MVWTEQELEERAEIFRLQIAAGVRRLDLAIWAGFGEGPRGSMAISRWASGHRKLTPEQIAGIRKGLEEYKPPLRDVPLALGDEDEAGPGGLDEPLGESTARRARRFTREELEALAGDPDPDERDELRALCKVHRKAAVGRMLDLMCNAKSETVACRAAEWVVDRADGRAIQAVVDLTPKAPVEDDWLIAEIEKQRRHAARNVLDAIRGNDERVESSRASGA